MAARFPSALATIVMLGLAACQRAPATLSEADRQAIQAASDQFLQHFQAKDWDALSQLYAEDAVLMPPNHPAVVGRAAIREFTATFPPVVEFSLTNDVIDGIGDLAYVRGRYRMTLAIEGTPTDSGKYIEIRRRQPDGSWKFTADIFNSSVPLPPSGHP
ncbi:MAG: nuclear transport factor 2 family protein [Gemmatimonadetes bacterium]|nr:nuclear transport factor 2 family protein [Gemmatimonadota bacterium]MBI2537934.1 nuclear transport factor 2 family protein [Gemmatimonadota bacterium]